MFLRSSIINSSKGGDSSIQFTNYFAQALFEIIIKSCILHRGYRNIYFSNFWTMKNLLSRVFKVFKNLRKKFKKWYSPMHQRMFRCPDWGRNIYRCSDPNQPDTSPKLKCKNQQSWPYINYKRKLDFVIEN